MEKNLTTGSVFGNIVRFSLPYLLSYFLQTLYGMADLFIIGQYEGVAGTTAVAIGSQVMHMLTVMIVGLAMGATVTIGQAVGARDRRGAAGCIGNTTTLFLALSVVLTGLLLALARPIAAVMSTPAEAVPGTVAYLRICFLGVPLITAYNIIASIFRGLGDSKRPMYFIAVACAVNIALDYLFMGALHMGPAGAALGTTLAQAVSVVVSLLVIRRERDGIALTRSDFRPQRAVMGRILRIGVPVALQDGLIQIAFLFITVIANRRGLTDAAAVGIVEKIISFLFLVPSSMLSTVSALGAQCIGAGKPAARCRRCGMPSPSRWASASSSRSSSSSWPSPSSGLFTDDAAVAAAGGQYLRGYILDCCLAGLHFCFSGYFCAIGRSVSFLNITAVVLVRVPGAYLTSKWFPHTAAHGSGHGGGLAAVSHHLRDCVSGAAAARPARAGGGLTWRVRRNSFPSATWRSCFT
ncbi:MAG: MATE family efflux transporter [Oscillospiraceae bacterium]